MTGPHERTGWTAWNGRIGTEGVVLDRLGARPNSPAWPATVAEPVEIR